MYGDLLTQTVTYWGTPVNDGTGKFTYATPVTKTCRWETRTENSIDADGSEFVSKAVVFASEQFDLNGWCYLGTSTETNPQLVEGAYKVKLKKHDQDPHGFINVYEHILG